MSCLMASFTICGHSESQNKSRQAGGLMVKEDGEQLLIELFIVAVQETNVYNRKIG